MDPESGFDGMTNVAIRNDRIVEISSEPLDGKLIIDVSGLVVAPGFIDLHAHGQSNKANEYQAHDGVTTALELEGGKPFVGAWLASREGQALINYGASVSHAGHRWMAMAKYAHLTAQADSLVASGGLGESELRSVVMAAGGARYESLDEEEMNEMSRRMKAALAQGGLGIGVPVGYYPGATRHEILRVYATAAANETIIFSHVRDLNIPAVQEAIANAAVTGASLHIVHINSISLGKIHVSLEMIQSAQKQGLDITTELYPYTAASTGLESTLFDPGWQDRMGISYGDLQWESTGERLTERTFRRYRKQGGTVIIHLMKAEWIEAGLQAPFTIVASDGMPYAPKAHPRSAGTFSRVLGRYVREAKTLGLMQALGKMTIMPARRLEGIAPMMRYKGRLQVGCDADITVFDPATIIDTANFEEGLSKSRGIEHVMVNGTFVVQDGRHVSDVYPGRAILGKGRR